MSCYHGGLREQRDGYKSYRLRDRIDVVILCWNSGPLKITILLD